MLGKKLFDLLHSWCRQAENQEEVAAPPPAEMVPPEQPPVIQLPGAVPPQLGPAPFTLMCVPTANNSTAPVPVNLGSAGICPASALPAVAPPVAEPAPAERQPAAVPAVASIEPSLLLPATVSVVGVDFDDDDIPEELIRQTLRPHLPPSLDQWRPQQGIRVTGSGGWC